MMFHFKCKRKLFVLFVLCTLTTSCSSTNGLVNSSSPAKSDKNSKTIGILGGMGPHSSAVFYLDVIDEYLKYENARPSILFWNVPLNLEKEKMFIENGEFKDYFLDKLIDGANHLKEGKADFVTIPCNTVHIFFSKLEQQVDIKFLSIIKETTEYLVKEKVKKILLLATSTTIKNKLYSKALEEAGIEVYIPDEDDQLKIDGTIVNLVNRKETINDKEVLDEIIDKFKTKGVPNLLLACTDLQAIVKQENYQMRVYDSMKILVSATVKQAIRK
ncbi:aspartate/glutamate racemase family protein [Planctomycetota bacterium]